MLIPKTLVFGALRTSCPRNHGGVQAPTSPPKERYAVSQDNVIKLAQPGEFCVGALDLVQAAARGLLVELRASYATSASPPR
jgi:hypothetical protein